ncbi:short-chain dehydrogenase/reductase family 16C member 6-like isoform X2 [Odontomachus brunneus]|uniref:short-chain dehydrogenase/reductase family 16C member 6-like isoform X2 n=1 Tax=Odontomachus brunneus TaxID=486640 RepID=UPI0013F18F84|nr:short-chain dehydrogenase/reductase family 16C member 6-like isoform X2 [Odontomachus brunneus]XP_032678858.1 short-chain dehydrogenase/reductase family 16C member 6-like isoform X2 [Odontomachus brunneus]
MTLFKSETLKNTQLPKMLLRIYSVFVLTMDLVMLFIKICYIILTSIYRIFRPKPLKNLYGEVAMVVGAGSGVGRELALHLCQLGVTVACVDINVDSCNATVQRALQLHGKCKRYQCDVRNNNAVIDTVNLIKDQLGDITMLFHCCGLPSPRALIEEPLGISATMDLSVISYFWLLDAVLPCMQRAGRGHITILSSVAGLSSGASGRSRIPLSTAQFAVQGLAESLLMDLRHLYKNIVVTLIHIYPFIIGTEVVKDIRFRLPSYFGTISAAEAARQILNGVRRNYAECSVPGYLLYLGHILRILPKEASIMLREMLDTGVDFA